MGGVRFTAMRIDILFRVAVVCGDDGDTAERNRFFDDAAEFAIDGFDGGDDRGNVSGVSDHVGIREVDEEKIGFFVQIFNRFVSDFPRPHGWRLVMSRYILPAFDDDLFFSREGEFAATV